MYKVVVLMPSEHYIMASTDSLDIAEAYLKNLMSHITDSDAGFCIMHEGNVLCYSRD